MNYRHAFHAGNFADVLKHLLFTQVITYLRRKSAPFRVIDTHAGAGLYELDSDSATKTGEWREGIGRLLEADIPEELAFFFSPLLDAIERVNGGSISGGLRLYPGSPVLAAELIRPHDVLIANELHPDDRQSLEQALVAYRATVR